MGIGTLRRYHKKADVSEVVDDSPAVTPAGESADEHPETERQIADADGSERQSPEGPVVIEADGGENAENTDGTITARTDDDTTLLPKPPLSGTGSGVQAWREYAVAAGKTDAELDGLSRDEIAALFD